MRELAEIVRLRSGEGRQVATSRPPLSAGPADGPNPTGSPDRARRGTEAAGEEGRARAEAAAYQRILHQLRGMRHEVVEPPPGALAAVLAALEAAAAEQQASGATWVVRAVYVGGITVATAAVGAAGVRVWMSRRRLGLPVAS